MIKGLLGKLFNKKEHPYVEEMKGKNVDSLIESTLEDNYTGWAEDDASWGVSHLTDKLKSTPLPGSYNYGDDPFETAQSSFQLHGGDVDIDDYYKTIDNSGDYESFKWLGDIADGERQGLDFYTKENPESGEMEWFSPGSDFYELDEGFYSNEFMDALRSGISKKHDRMKTGVEENLSYDELYNILRPTGAVEEEESKFYDPDFGMQTETSLAYYKDRLKRDLNR